MNGSEKQVIWKRFLKEFYSTKPRLSSLLSNSRVLDSDKGCKVCIPVANPAQEQWLSEKCLGQIVLALEKAIADYKVLKPISFAFQREDGTVVDAEVNLSEPQPQKQTTRSFPNPPIHIMSREEMIQTNVSEETSRFLTEVQSWINNDTFPDEIRECKGELTSILGELQKSRQTGNTFESLNELLSGVQPTLVVLSKIIGAESNFYIQITSLVVNSALNIIISIVNGAQNYSNTQSAISTIESLESYSMSANTRARLELNKQRINNIQSRIRYYHSQGYTSEGKLRLSERIERFARRIYSVESGGKRYTSPLLGLIALPVFIIAWLVSIFDKK